jgi:hypothetical protein
MRRRKRLPFSKAKRVVDSCCSTLATSAPWLVTRNVRTPTIPGLLRWKKWPCTVTSPLPVI